MSNVALAVEATLREHVHNTFDEALGKMAMAAPSSSSHHSPLLKWRSRVRERERERERERKVVEKKGTAQERVRERKRKRNILKNFSILL